MSREPKPHFLNIRTWKEMPLWKQWVWRMFGTKRIGFDESKEDYTVRVTAYTFRNITLVWSLEWMEGRGLE